MNREDVIALRWPHACLSCGQDVSPHIDSRYAILGMFHETKDTQILLKLAGFFYICEECDEEITEALSHPSDKVVELARHLKEHPWNEFIHLEKDGTIRVPQGEFSKKLLKMNPEVDMKENRSPIEQMRKLIAKG